MGARGPPSGNSSHPIVLSLRRSRCTRLGCPEQTGTQVKALRVERVTALRALLPLRALKERVFKKKRSSGKPQFLPMPLLSRGRT